MSKIKIDLEEINTLNKRMKDLNIIMEVDNVNIIENTKKRIEELTNRNSDGLTLKESFKNPNFYLAVGAGSCIGGITSLLLSISERGASETIMQNTGAGLVLASVAIMAGAFSYLASSSEKGEEFILEKIEKSIRNKSRMNELSKSLKEVVNNVSIAEKSPTVENKKAILNSLLDLNLKIGTDNYTHNNSKILERINSIVEENKLEKKQKNIGLHMKGI